MCHLYRHGWVQVSMQVGVARTRCSPAFLAASICAFCPSQSICSGICPALNVNWGRGGGPSPPRNGSLASSTGMRESGLIWGTADVAITSASAPSIAWSSTSPRSSRSPTTICSPLAPSCRSCCALCMRRTARVRRVRARYRLLHLHASAQRQQDCPPPHTPRAGPRAHLVVAHHATHAKLLWRDSSFSNTSFPVRPPAPVTTTWGGGAGDTLSLAVLACPASPPAAPTPHHLHRCLPSACANSCTGTPPRGRWRGARGERTRPTCTRQHCCGWRHRKQRNKRHVAGGFGARRRARRSAPPISDGTSAPTMGGTGASRTWQGGGYRWRQVQEPARTAKKEYPARTTRAGVERGQRAHNVVRVCVKGCACVADGRALARAPSPCTAPAARTLACGSSAVCPPLI